MERSSLLVTNGRHFCTLTTVMIPRTCGTVFCAALSSYLSVQLTFECRSLFTYFRHLNMCSHLQVWWTKKLQPLALEMLESME